jgi:hypothetical protein
MICLSDVYCHLYYDVSIQPALQDQMEIIRIGYTIEEK